MNIKRSVMAAIVVVGAAGVLGSTAAFAATTTTNSTPTTSNSQTQGQQHGKHNHWNGSPEGKGRLGAGNLFKGVASTLKIDEQTLRNDLKAGQSLAQIAQSKGVSEDSLIASVESNFKQQLNQAVSNGKLTAAQEAAMVTKFNANAKNMVERKGLPNGPMGMKHRGSRMDMRALIQKLGLDEATVKQGLASGQSIADIAAAHGISDATLMADAKAVLQQQIQQDVTNGHLTQAQAQQALSKMSSHLNDMLHAKHTANPNSK